MNDAFKNLWLPVEATSGRVLDLRGRWFEYLWRHHVISLCKRRYTLFSTGTTRQCPDMTDFFDWDVKYQLRIIEVNSCSVLVC